MNDTFFASSDAPAHFGFAAVQEIFPRVISPSRLRALMGQGKGPVYRKVGGKIVFERESFLAWLNARVEK